MICDKLLPAQVPIRANRQVFRLLTILKNAITSNGGQTPETTPYFITNRPRFSTVLQNHSALHLQIVSIKNQDNCGLAEHRRNL
ncbi:hypothetical protein CSC3H3_13115 [Thalassospira marina]|uniref:Uncharacterized protein n=1 Tax=Thalassospira marina TaxID=2048283 RepID=A0A2N3KRB6_9PROT|nr:hypothetical protein CSC3H3_13115 [Thalassospira marina]PKR53081.1 hypothetical protein COO20_15490 [Thalassospira marina]